MAGTESERNEAIENARRTLAEAQAAIRRHKEAMERLSELGIPRSIVQAINDAVDDSMTVRDAAALLRVHENTIRNWIRAGHLRHITLPSGFRRPLVSAVRARMEGHEER